MKYLLTFLNIAVGAMMLGSCGGSASGPAMFCDTACLGDTLRFNGDGKLKPWVAITASECRADTIAWSYDGMGVNRKIGLADLPPGPVNQRLPKVLKAPEGHTYAWTENPLGINGYYLVSKGEKTPYRLKLRSASYNNIQALTELLPGTLVADMVAILGSLFFVVGDIDK